MTQLTHTPHCYETAQFEIGYDDGQYAENKIEPSAGLKPTYSSVIKWGAVDIHGNIHDVQTSHPVDDVPSDDDHPIHDEPARPKTPRSLATSALVRSNVSLKFQQGAELLTDGLEVFHPLLRGSGQWCQECIQKKEESSWRHSKCPGWR